ncbi:hypothetical protein [Mucilaginibacter sp. dw_454]|uniref:O-antigen ligase family protein n=1 Tax=Mucilaginibacter sp. dw_454 TaxID=2720079 RepID=UPI001BD2FE1C|nr:hypothetical protein [Mucilaginibacter sp. dw_454]
MMSVREIYKGRVEGVLLFMIFGLSMYTTAMSVSFLYGLKGFIPFFQFFKEILVLSVLVLNIVNLKYRPRLHLVDYLIFGFFAYTLIYALLPIGQQGFVDRLVAFKSTSFYILVYFAGRFFDPKTIYINKYFSYVALLTIAAGAVLVVEVSMHVQLQIFTGYAEYCYYFFNIEPSGVYGLSTTFDSDSGLRRFASFFNNPLEHAAATLLALSIVIALYNRDDNKFKPTLIGWLALGASLLSITFALSRAPLIAYFLIIYVYALATKKKYITNTVHVAVGLLVVYLIYLFSQYESSNHKDGLIAVLMNTVDFSDPSSVGHLVQWVEGIAAMIAHPLGLGLGSSGRVAGSLGENVGGENQFIIIGVQAGVIALLLYLAIYVIFIRTSIKWFPKLGGKEKKICLAILLIKVGFFIPMLTSEVESSSYLSYMDWFLSGIFISMIMYPVKPQLQPTNDN